MNTSSPLALSYRPDLNVLTVHWPAGNDLATLQPTYESLLRSESVGRTAHWLFDVRRAPVPSPELVNWIATNWLPRAAARVAPDHLRLAYLILPRQLREGRADLSLYATIRDQVAAAATTARTSLFIDEGPAVGWLRS
jgi:hypothetical protein